jgi:hypothetical protein
VLEGQRAEYGGQLVPTASRQLGWSHVVELIPLKDDLKRDFYFELCRVTT